VLQALLKGVRVSPRLAISAALLALSLHLPSLARAAEGPSATLGAVFLAYLPDSGGRVRGLAWTSGDGLPVRWHTFRPTTNPDRFMHGKGLTLTRTGDVLVDLDGGDPVAMRVMLAGNLNGVQRTSLSLPYDGNVENAPHDRVERALVSAGFVLTALKCDRDAEGVMFGNVVSVAKAPRKTSAALWENWNCSGLGECALTLTLLYRTSDLSEVECASR
jgi:hypothetical protein